MKMPEHPVLQHRWALRDGKEGKTLVYYGLRNPPRQHESVVPIPDFLAEALNRLDGSADLDSLPRSVRESGDFLRLVEQEGLPAFRSRPTGQWKALPADLMAWLRAQRDRCLTRAARAGRAKP
jgi:hypothetical protein